MMLTQTRGRMSCLAFLLLFAACTVVCAGQSTEAAGKPARTDTGDVKVMTVFLVRHAEKAAAPAQDPPLNEAGRMRAETLARMLEKSGVKAIYTSQYLRTKETGETVAKRLGVTVSSVSLSSKPDKPREVSDESIRALTDKVLTHAGEAVLVVGHSNSVPEVIRMLGGDVVPKIEESVFDDLFVVTVYAGGRAKVVQLKYGSAN